MTRLLNSACLLALLTACTTRQATPSTEVAIPAPDSAPARSAAVAPSAPLSGWQPPQYDGPALGEPCVATEPAPPSQSAGIRPPQEPVCGSEGRVSLEIVRHLELGEPPPCEPRVFDQAEALGYSRTFCVTGDELVVSTACFMCRMMNVGEVAHARLSQLTPEQHQLLAKLAGIPKTPRDANEWRALFARAQSVPSATEVAPP